jgi:Flp pilus assembly protein TadG
VVEGALRGRTPPAFESTGEPPRPRFLRLLWRNEQGTAVVEFALIALPLCLIVFGILDFGRALNYFNDVTQLAGQGARAAAVNQNVDGTQADSTFQAKLAAEADSPEMTNKVQVCIVTMPTAVGQPVTVSVKYRFHFNAIIAKIPITLRSTQSMRSETPSPTYTNTCTPATLP